MCKGQVTGGWGIKVDLFKGKAQPDVVFPHCGPVNASLTWKNHNFRSPHGQASSEERNETSQGEPLVVLQVVPPGELQAGPSKPGSVRASGHLNPSPTVEAEHTILPATPFLMSPHFMFLASLFPFSCCQRGRRCRRSPEGHQTSRGQGCRARGEIRWNISHVLLASLQGLSIISLCAVGAVLVWHLKGMLWEDFTTSCHFTVQNRCELITHGNLCLHEPLPLPSLRTQQLSHSRQINHEDCVIG